MKGDGILEILENITEFGEDLSTTIEAVLTLGYRASIRGVEYKKSKIRRERENRKEKMRTRKIKQNLIYKLEKDGLIERKKEGKISAIFKTKKGLEKEQELKEKREMFLSKNGYKTKKSDKFSIITFDIPEIERKKRDWIREALKNLKFRMVHKSVWMAKVKIPREFIDKLFKLRMNDYVEIFEISKTGSLRHLV